MEEDPKLLELREKFRDFTFQPDEFAINLYGFCSNLKKRHFTKGIRPTISIFFENIFQEEIPRNKEVDIEEILSSFKQKYGDIHSDCDKDEFDEQEEKEFASDLSSLVVKLFPLIQIEKQLHLSRVILLTLKVRSNVTEHRWVSKLPK